MLKHKYQINHATEQYINISTNTILLNPDYKIIMDNSMKIVVKNQLGQEKYLIYDINGVLWEMRMVNGTLEKYRKQGTINYQLHSITFISPIFYENYQLNIEYDYYKYDLFDITNVQLYNNITFLMDFLNISYQTASNQEDLQKSYEFIKRQLFPKFINDLDLDEPESIYEELLEILSIFFYYHSEFSNNLVSIYEMDLPEYFDMRTFYRKLKDYDILNDYLVGFENNIQTYQIVSNKFINNIIKELVNKGNISSFQEMVNIIFSYYRFSTNYVILQFNNLNGMTQYVDYEYNQYFRDLNELNSLKEQIKSHIYLQYKDDIDNMVNDRIKKLYSTHSIPYLNTIKQQIKNEYQEMLINQLLQRTIVILYNTTQDRIYSRGQIEGSNITPNQLIINFLDKLFIPFNVNLIYLGIQMLPVGQTTENVGRDNAPVNDTIQLHSMTDKREKKYGSIFVGNKI